jgi:hypothetical protein
MRALCRTAAHDPKRIYGSEPPGEAVVGEAYRAAAGNKPCNFILSAPASPYCHAAVLSIMLGQEEITGNDSRAILEGLIRAKTLGEGMRDTSSGSVLCVAAASCH